MVAQNTKHHVAPKKASTTSRTRITRVRVEVTVEITAHVPDGVSDEIGRIVTENCQTLRFRTHGFEEE